MPRCCSSPEISTCSAQALCAAPARDDLVFIQQCEQSLADGCFIQALRIDAAGYQAKIIQYCDEKDIPYNNQASIRAKMSAAIKEQIDSLNEAD